MIFGEHKQRQQNHLSSTEIESSNAQADRRTSPDSEIENFELKLQLEECIDTLPEKWKDVVNAKFIEEQSSEDICDNFALSSSNYWVIIHRAKMQLKECLSSFLG